MTKRQLFKLIDTINENTISNKFGNTRYRNRGRLTEGKNTLLNKDGIDFLRTETEGCEITINKLCDGYIAAIRKLRKDLKRGEYTSKNEIMDVLRSYRIMAATFDIRRYCQSLEYWESWLAYHDWDIVTGKESI